MVPWRARAARACGLTASVFLAAMMLLTVVDVALRALLNVPVRGAFELVELLLACTFFLALPAAFLRDEHIVVDLLDAPAPHLVPKLKRIALMIAIVILATMAWQGLRSAHDVWSFGDVSSDLSIPRVLYWIPVLLGMVGAAIAAGAMLFDRTERS